MTIPATRAERIREFVDKTTEASIHIALLALMALFCFAIMRPFILLLVWGLVLGIAVQPVHAWLTKRLGGRKGLSAIILTIVGLVCILGPAMVLFSSMVDGLQTLAEHVRHGTLDIPPPPEWLDKMPLADKITAIWTSASENLEHTLQELMPELKPMADKLLHMATGMAVALLQLCAAIIIAGIMLYRTEPIQRFSARLLTRLTGAHSQEYRDLATATIRSVALGVVGVAVIQSLLAGIGFVAAGIPAAGLLAFVVLFISIIQIPTLLIMAPMIAYGFATMSTTVAAIFAVWCLFVGVSDNILKPILFGRGVRIPMLVILIGAIGGMVLTGIIGLFVGAVILALGYKLFVAWLDADSAIIDPHHPVS